MALVRLVTNGASSSLPGLMEAWAAAARSILDRASAVTHAPSAVEPNVAARRNWNWATGLGQRGCGGGLVMAETGR
jgi:hypothetical protein